MKFGLFMMPLHPPRRSYSDSYDRDIELIVQADKLGYTEVCTYSRDACAVYYGPTTNHQIKLGHTDSSKSKVEYI